MSVRRIDDQDYASGAARLAPLPPGLRAGFERHRTEPQLVPDIPTRVPARPFLPTLADALPRTDPDAFWAMFEQKYPGAAEVRVS